MTEPSTTLTLAQAIKLATEHHASGNLQQAEYVIKQILSSSPGYPPALHLLGVIAHSTGNVEQALSLIGDAIKSDPKQGLYYSNYAEISRLNNNIADAITYGKMAVALSPSSPATHSNLGLAYFDNGDFDLAEQHQQNALKLNPSFAAALNNLGSIKRERKERLAAIEMYRKVISTHPTHVESMSNLGGTLCEAGLHQKATPILLKAIQLNPQFTEAHCNLGLAFLGLEDFDRSQLAFENALKLKPDYPNALLGLAKLHFERLETEKAETISRSLLASNPNFHEASTLLASILLENGDTEQAEQFLNVSLRICPNSASTLIALGTLYMEQGKLQEAEEIFLKVCDIDPENALSAHISLAQVKKTSPDAPHFLALKKAQLNIEKLNNKLSVALLFALGKCFDDLKEANQAFSFFDSACRLKRPTINYSAESHSRHIQAIIDCFSSQFINTHQNIGTDSTLPIFVVGMPRSGTTLVEQIIASHSGVFGAGELSYLTEACENVDARNKENFPHNITSFKLKDFEDLATAYCRQLASHSDQSVRITDKMPINFKFIGLIQMILQNAKIIHVKRNAVDTCLSCFTKHFKHGQPFSYDLEETANYYKDYDRLMTHWRNVLPEGTFLDVEYENIVQDKERETRRILKYCDLNWEDACLEPHKNTRNIRTASLVQVRQPLYSSSVQRWLPYKDHLTPLLNTLGSLAPEIE